MHIAIIGSGPSAFYTCQGLLNSIEGATIDIIEKLPAPFGLVRYGVAPDHQKTKNIIKLFSKILDNEKVSFFGNIDVGKDVSLEFISNNYDAVVLASGAENDKKLSIPGENKEGVYGSSQFVGWYNGIPEYRKLEPDLNKKNVTIIGNGNVALDCARLLAKKRDELFNSDITDYSLNVLTRSFIKNIYVIGRRSPLESKFTIAELREIGNLADFNPVIEYPLDLLEKMTTISDLDTRIKKNLELLIEYKKSKDLKDNKIIFKFLSSPVEIMGDEKVEKIKLRKNIIEGNKLRETSDHEEIETGLVISAIGYNTNKINSLPLDKYESYYLNDDGYIDKNIYVTGWAASNSVGVIGTNKAAAQKVSARISQEITSTKSTSNELQKFLKEKNKRYVTKEDWLKIDKKEVADASENFVRKKTVDIEGIFKYLDT